jgi:hypothetical protein
VIFSHSSLSSRVDIGVNSLLCKLVYIYLLDSKQIDLGISDKRLIDIKEDLSNFALDYIYNEKVVSANPKRFKDTLEILFHSLLAINYQKQPRKITDMYTLSDLSKDVSLAKVYSAKKLYLSLVLRGNTIMRWKILRNLRNNILSQALNSIYLSLLIQKIDDYLDSYYWKKFKTNKGYHRYWNRPEVKFTLRKASIDQTLGLDLINFEFLNNSIELHHIFENTDSLYLSDIVSLGVSSHRSYTFSTKFLSQEEWLLRSAIISMRSQKLIELFSLDINRKNETKVRDEFSKNKLLWSSLTQDKIDELVKRWIDKKGMSEEDWYAKYNLQIIYSDFNSVSKDFLGKDNRYEFWFYQNFLRKYFKDFLIFYQGRCKIVFLAISDLFG